LVQVYFDSSVFVAIFMGENTGSCSGASIRAHLKELKRDKIKIYTSILTIQEVSVGTYRKGTVATDNFSKVHKLARITGITKEVALTAAKYEAHIKDQTAEGDQEDNKRRKWDCFHIAAAMELGCSVFYTCDDKQLKRKKQFGIKAMEFSYPVPKKPELFDSMSITN